MASIGVDTLAMAVPRQYGHANGTTPAHTRSREVTEALYRTRRVEVPFRPVLLGC